MGFTPEAASNFAGSLQIVDTVDFSFTQVQVSYGRKMNAGLLPKRALGAIVTLQA